MQIEVGNASLLVDYSDQKLTLGGREMIIKKHLSQILQNQDLLSKKQILNELSELNDLIDRY